MRTWYRLIVAFGASYVLLNLYSYITPEWLCAILSVVALVALVVALLFTAVRGFRTWRKTSQYWMVPALVSIAFILTTWLVPPLGRSIADLRFKSHLSDYEKIVVELRNDANFPNSTAGAGLNLIKDKKLPSHVQAIKAGRCGDRVMVAAFLLETDVPLLHEGYVYKGYQETDSCVGDVLKPENNWPYIRHVYGNWYHFSDQPGL